MMHYRALSAGERKPADEVSAECRMSEPKVLLVLLALVTQNASPFQGVLDPDPTQPAVVGGGWGGFSDFAFLVKAAIALVLASLLGAVIAYHPRSRRTVDRLEEAEAQKVYVLYSVIGALTGVMVTKYGVVVGFVVFGIGGLIRFRTDLRAGPLTGRLILVTLIGLSCGLDLPHLAVLATAFSFVLIAVLDASVTYRIVVKGLPASAVPSAARAYRDVLAQEGCRVLGERKSLAKEQLALVFRAPNHAVREQLEQRLQTVPGDLRGTVDWEVE